MKERWRNSCPRTLLRPWFLEIQSQEVAQQKLRPSSNASNSQFKLWWLPRRITRNRSSFQWLNLLSQNFTNTFWCNKISYSWWNQKFDNLNLKIWSKFSLYIGKLLLGKLLVDRLLLLVHSEGYWNRNDFYKPVHKILMAVKY